jgi:hypothetical protein
MHVASPNREWPPIPFGALGKGAGLTWAYVEPARGRFQWYGIDRFIAAAETHRVDFFYAFANTPQWASVRPTEHCYHGNVGCAAPPARIEYWNEFVTALVRRYKGRIKFYEIWDEANMSTSWSGTHAELVSLARNAYNIIKSIDPNALVLTPAMTGQIGWQPRQSSISGVSAVWLERYLQAGGNKYADGGNWHGYLMRTTTQTFRMPEDEASPCFIASWNYTKACYGSILNEIDTLRAVLDRNGLAGKPIFNTEGSWGNGSLTNSTVEAAWLARYYLLQAGKGIARVYWYGWGFNAWGNLASGAGENSLVETAYRQIYKWLVGATMAGPCTPLSNRTTWTCGLTRPGNYRALAVWSTSGTQSFTTESDYKQYRDLSGNIFPMKGPLQIGIEPLLLETSAPQ